ncbi:MAG: hypothetical protein ACRC41_01470 [Sarcina sp.]
MNYGLWKLAMRGRRKALRKQKYNNYNANSNQYTYRDKSKDVSYSSYKKNQMQGSTLKAKFWLWYINYMDKKHIKYSKKCNYNIYLQGNYWGRVSYEAKQFYNNKCQICGAKATETHHLNYNHLGAESINDILVLCHKCHFDKIHNKIPASQDYNNAYIKRGLAISNELSRKRTNKDAEIERLKKVVQNQKVFINKQNTLLNKQSAILIEIQNKLGENLSSIK